MMNKRYALVTGGSRGLGRGIVKSLASSGVDVMFTYNSDNDSADQVLKESIDASGNVIFHQMNVGSRDSIKEVVEISKKHFPRIDILVNNAGIAQEKPFNTITDSDWEMMMNVNLQGPFALIQELIPSMIENKWGRIINISSIGGQWGGLNQVHYAASKAALINLTRSIAKIYSKDGVTSNAISPGLIATDMAANELDSDAGKEKVKGIPMQRIGRVNEVGSSVVFLSSDEASYITGQTLNLNGGMFFST